MTSPDCGGTRKCSSISTLTLRWAWCVLILTACWNLSAQTPFNGRALSSFLPHITYTGTLLQLKDLGYLESTAADFGIDQVISRFSTGHFERKELNELHNFGSDNISRWFGVSVVNKAANSEPLYLDFDSTNPDQIELWIIELRDYGQEVAYRQSGHDIPAIERDLFNADSAIKLDLKPGRETILIWRIQRSGPTILSMCLIRAGELYTELQSNAMAIMTLIGGLISLMLFSIFLYNAVRDRTYLFFIVQLAGFSLYLFCLHGYGNMYIWQHSQTFDKLINDVALIGALLPTLQLLRLFLYTHTDDPWLDRGLILLACLLPIVLVAVVFAFELGIYLLLVCIGLIFLITHIAAIRAFFRRGRSILVPLIGWVIISWSGAITALIYAGFQVPGPAMAIMFRAEHWGIFIGSILFMFALTQRIQYLRRDKEKAEHKNRLKQDFIANISHEMRTPLNGIIGFSESIAHSEHLGEIKFYNKSIISESERLLFQINQLLDLAKIEAGRFELEHRPFSLPQSLAYLQSAYSMKANAKGLDFNLSMDSACPLALNGDRLRLEQILRNLIDNAIKFTDSGTIGVSVRVYRQDQTGAVLVFDINDTGIGIDQDKLDLIMEDFVQADSSITRRFGGTGLGTSIARRLVEAMEGHIEVRSSAGMGTNFRIYLPFGIAPGIPDDSPIELEPHRSTPPLTSSEPSPPRQAPVASRRILVVDDLETNRQVLGIHLKSMQIMVDEAEDAEKALSMLASTTYDLVLMDVFMPGMSGHDATRAIRLMPGLANLPVIAVTASGFQQDLDAARDAGMNEVLLKPVKREALRSLISRYIEL